MFKRKIKKLKKKLVSYFHTFSINNYYYYCLPFQIPVEPWGN